MNQQAACGPGWRLLPEASCSALKAWPELDRFTVRILEQRQIATTAGELIDWCMMMKTKHHCPTLDTALFIPGIGKKRLMALRAAFMERLGDLPNAQAQRPGAGVMPEAK